MSFSAALIKLSSFELIVPGSFTITGLCLISFTILLPFFNPPFMRLETKKPPTAIAARAEAPAKIFYIFRFLIRFFY